LRPAASAGPSAKISTCQAGREIVRAVAADVGLPVVALQKLRKAPSLRSALCRRCLGPCHRLQWQVRSTSLCCGPTAASERGCASPTQSARLEIRREEASQTSRKSTHPAERKVKKGSPMQSRRRSPDLCGANSSQKTGAAFWRPRSNGNGPPLRFDGTRHGCPIWLAQKGQAGLGVSQVSPPRKGSRPTSPRRAGHRCRAVFLCSGPPPWSPASKATKFQAQRRDQEPPGLAPTSGC